MTGEERDALDVLERIAAHPEAPRELWTALTVYRAGGSLVTALGVALDAVVMDFRGALTEAELDRLERLSEEAREAADRAEDAACDAESALTEARRRTKTAGR